MNDIPASLADAVGRIVTSADMVTASPVAGLAAAFGREDPPPAGGDELPPLWHGLFCTAKLPPSRLGEDGLAKDEGLLPAVPDFPNKLFGGARYRFEAPLLIGDEIVKESEVMSFDLKEGRTGAFIVGLVQHRVSNAHGVAIVEENDIIFRPPAPRSSGAAPSATSATPANATTDSPAASDAAWTRVIAPDPVLMFRHSAVTFNSHRIHYDRDYARAHGYPGLLVQGTLIARLLMELVRDERQNFEAATFSFRSGRPVYDDGAFTLCGAPDADGALRLWVLDQAGKVGMTARTTPR